MQQDITYQEHVNYFKIWILNKITVCVHFSFCSETYKVHFVLQTLPELQQLDLVLMSGECEVNCDGRQNNCSVSLVERSMTNVSISEQTSH